MELRKRTGPKPGSKHKNSRARKFTLPPGESGFNKLYGGYKRNAIAAGREFSLSKSEFRALTSANCVYCGISPSNTCHPHGTTTSQYAVERGSYKYNGLDRIDNSKGYLLTNVVTACFICNRAKSIMTHEEFLTWINRIVTTNKKSEITCQH